ncbi:MAG: signal peptidase [Desulfobacteraceae bacterium 4572_130]|nr:MAG: signal peptidase [Desulfobacteraceae bacterium 4572_130]
MFSRRHPFLFFTLILSTIIILGGICLITIFIASTSLISSNIINVSNSNGNVGIIEIKGIITSSKEIIQNIKEFKENDSIKAIVLRVDSPGGGVAPSQEIYREIIKLKKKKKVVASFGAVAASGGYYIASASDSIVANPGTITGSIGVIMEYVNIEDIVKKIRLIPIVIKSGEFKDMGSPVRPLKDKERKIFQNIVNEIHTQFVRDVALGRKIDQRKIAKLADGRIYTGEQALAYNLVDKIGNLSDAIAFAGKLAEIKKDEIKAVYPKKDKMSSIKDLFHSLLKDAYISSTVTDYFRYVIN